MNGSERNRPRLTFTPLLLIGTLIPLSTGNDSAASPPAESTSVNRPAGDQEARPIQSLSTSRVLISCQTAPGPSRLTGVDLWYTKDAGATWSKQSHAAPTGSIVFDADADGLYGFYVVLHNSAGVSGPVPTAGTPPQRLVRIDRSAPVVSILSADIDEHFDANREIHLRWSARDEDLPDRPVKLHYRTEQTKMFRLLADSQTANSSYRWTIPENVTGRLEIKISAVDRAGNLGQSVIDWLAIDPTTKQAIRTTQRPAFGDEINPSAVSNRATAGSDAKSGATGRPNNDVPRSTAGGAGGLSTQTDQAVNSDAASGPQGSDPPGLAPTIDAARAKRTQNLYDQATWHRLRGEYDLATARLRETLELNPRLLNARNDLAGVLFLQGRHEEAEQEYRAVLAEDARHIAALKGLALVQAARRNYQSSREALLKLVDLAPDDAEAWLYLGDAALFTGDRPAAREAWTKVESLPDASPEVRKRAKSRLGIYGEEPSTSRSPPTERETHHGANQ